MKYYQITYDIHQLGRVPQAQSMKPYYDYEAPGSVWKIPFTGEITVQPDMDSIIMEYHSKKTDIINAVPINSIKGLIISLSFFNILKKFRIDLYQSFPAIVEHRNKKYQYIFFHFSGDGNRFVDFEKSNFFIAGAEQPTDFKILSYASLVEKQIECSKTNPITRVAAKSLYIDENNVNIDFFRIYGIKHPLYLVSERLKVELEKQKISGIKIIEDWHGLS